MRTATPSVPALLVSLVLLSCAPTQAQVCTPLAAGIPTLTLVAVPVFIAHGQVDWPLASALVVGFAIGGELGARAAIRGGERLIRPVLVISVLMMAGRMLSLY